MARGPIGSETTHMSVFWCLYFFFADQFSREARQSRKPHLRLPSYFYTLGRATRLQWSSRDARVVLVNDGRSAFRHLGGSVPSFPHLFCPSRWPCLGGVFFHEHRRHWWKEQKCPQYEEYYESASRRDDALACITPPTTPPRRRVHDDDDDDDDATSDRERRRWWRWWWTR